jgi:hypothetical protein
MQFDNKIFWVGFRRGSCGSFLALIISQLLWPEHSQVEDFPEVGHADRHLDLLVQQCRVINRKTSHITDFPVLVPDPEDLWPIHDRVLDLPYDEPELICTDHKIPSIKYCQVKFPKGKHLIITVSKKMLPRLFGNIYYKCLDRKEVKSAETIETYNKWWQHETRVRSGNLENLPLEDLPSWAVQEFVKRIEPISEAEWDNDPEGHRHWLPETRYDAEVEQHIWRVDMWRIIHDHEQLLEELASWVDRPVNDIARATWANYLRRQQELLPWIDDRNAV